MLAVERRIKVLERLAADQAVEVSSLAREFGVSEMTIRRDLHRLDRDGFVRRTYGGATTRVVRAQGTLEVGQNARMLHHAEEKRQIALKAAELTLGSSGTLEGLILQGRDTVKEMVPETKAAPKSGWLSNLNVCIDCRFQGGTTTKPTFWQ